MAAPTSTPPQLTPQFCFNTRVLRDFLRLSRAAIDDSIATHLNALLTPSTTTPFDPSSTSTAKHALPSSLTRSPIPEPACAAFVDNVLFPSWSARSHVLSYCASVATSPDPDDPELPAIQALNERERQRVVDERLDPYSGRFFPREARTEQLAGLLRNENAIEGIVRRRTWGVVAERCAVEADWEQAVRRWEEQQAGAQDLRKS